MSGRRDEDHGYPYRDRHLRLGHSDDRRLRNEGYPDNERDRAELQHRGSNPYPYERQRSSMVDRFESTAIPNNLRSPEVDWRRHSHPPMDGRFLDERSPPTQDGPLDDRHQYSYGRELIAYARRSGGEPYGEAVHTSSESGDSVAVNYPSFDPSAAWRQGEAARKSQRVPPQYNQPRYDYRQDMSHSAEHVTRRPVTSRKDSLIPPRAWGSDRKTRFRDRQFDSLPVQSESTVRRGSFSEVSSSHDPDIDRPDTIYPFERHGSLKRMHAEQAVHISVSDVAESVSVKTPGETEKRNPAVVKFLKHKRHQLAKNLTPHWPLDGFIAKTFTRAVVILLSYGAAWAVLGDNILPCSLLFSFSLLILLSAVGGFISKVFYLPPLVGMILVGFLFKNIPKFLDDKSGNSTNAKLGNVTANDTSNNMTTRCAMEAEVDCYALDDDWSSILRGVALVIILTRAGLSLNVGVLKKMKFVVARLAFLPSLAEACVEAVVAHFLLDMPWEWAFMTGFVIAAISPAVVVLGLLGLQKHGYGTAQGIPTLLIAAATGDDVLDISGFGICLGIAFAEGSLVFNAFRAPVELALGLAWGVVLGVMSWWLPSPERSHGYKARNRLIYLLACGLLTVFGGTRAGFTGAGALGVVVMSLVASHGWKTEKGPVAKSFKILWEYAQPALFGLTGAAVDVDFLSAEIIGLGLATLAVGIIARLAVTFLVVSGQGFTVKERIFIALAWLPKATVQAAIGSIAYDTAKEENSGQNDVDLGKKLLTISFLVIIICAPIGAAAIQFFGPRLLRQELSSVHEGSGDPTTPTAEPDRSGIDDQHGSGDDASEPSGVDAVETTV